MRLVAHFPLKKIKFVKYLILFIIGINQEGGGLTLKVRKFFLKRAIVSSIVPLLTTKVSMCAIKSSCF